MAHMLAMVVNALQSNRDQQLPRAEFAYNNSVRAATGLAPNVVHIGWRPRIHLTIFERTGIVGHQSLAGDHLAYCDVATDRQQGASDIVREHHALTVSLAWNATTQPSSTHCERFPKFAVAGWVSVYNTAAAVQQGAKTNMDAKVLQAKLWLNWTASYKVLAVAPELR